VSQRFPALKERNERGDMKIIFLDIDGVLNCKHTPNLEKFPYVVDPELHQCRYAS